MGQITIYLDDETEQRAKAAAQSARMSVSRWVSTAIQEKTADSWPQHFLELAGAWPDCPTAEQIRSGESADSRREDL